MARENSLCVHSRRDSSSLFGQSLYPSQRTLVGTLWGPPHRKKSEVTVRVGHHSHWWNPVLFVAIMMSTLKVFSLRMSSNVQLHDSSSNPQPEHSFWTCCLRSWVRVFTKCSICRERWAPSTKSQTLMAALFMTLSLWAKTWVNFFNRRCRKYQWTMTEFTIASEMTPP